jgi:hypothetical protein
VGYIISKSPPLYFVNQLTIIVLVYAHNNDLKNIGFLPTMHVFNLDCYSNIHIPMLLTLFPSTVLSYEVFSLPPFVKMRHIVSRCTWNEAARMLSNLRSIVRKARICL